MIIRTTSGWVAGLVALAFFGAACSSASGPEVVEPAAGTAAAETETDADADADGESSTDPVAAEQGNDSAGESQGESESSTAEPEGDTSEPAAPAVPVPEALQFTAPLVGGGEIDLAAGFDNKPTVFWFWAPT